MPSLLHLADVHLGARHDDMGEAATKQRERQLAAFVRAVDLALERHVDAVLICGDLFDSNAQPRRSVERAVAELCRLTERGIRVVIIPGTHDVYDGRSIYRAFDLPRMAGLPLGSDLLTVLTPDHPEIVMADIDMIVYGRVFATKRAPHSPLKDFSAAADDRGRWKVGMIHGSRRLPGVVEDDDVMFTDDEVEVTGLDYVALGHWHSFSSGRAGPVTWAYAGAPEPVAVDQDGAGHVALVRLSETDGVNVERIRVGRTSFRRESVDAADLAGGPDLIERLRRLADPDLILHVSIDGIAPDTLEIDTEEIERELAPSFLHVRVRDRSVTELGHLPDLSEDTVAGAFVADLEARLQAAEAAGDDEAAELARQILRLGRRMLLADPEHVTLP